jgi:hypothetical protein
MLVLPLYGVMLRGFKAIRSRCNTGRPFGRPGFLHLLALFCLCMQNNAAAGELIEAHRYIETTGDNRQEIHWRLEKDSEFTLTSTMVDEVSVCRIGTDFDTRLWRIARTDEATSLTAKRLKGEIHLSGRHGGTPIEARLKIDPAPWYQAGSFSLRAFAQSTQKETRFWILRPGKFTAHKLFAARQGKELLKIDGVSVSAHKIKVGLTGWKAPFWSAYYWFGARNGVFLRYQGPSGPPGSPDTVVEWVSSPAMPNSGVNFGTIRKRPVGVR